MLQFISSFLKREKKERKKSFQAWRKVWEEGHLEVNGNPDIALSLNAGLYYILSSIPLSRDPLNPFMGLSPGTFSIPVGSCPTNRLNWYCETLSRMHSSVGTKLTFIKFGLFGSSTILANYFGSNQSNITLPWNNVSVSNNESNTISGTIKEELAREHGPQLPLMGFVINQNWNVSDQPFWFEISVFLMDWLNYIFQHQQVFSYY